MILEKRQKRIDMFWLVVKNVILATVLAFIIRGFILIPVQVEGNSMENTLNQNDMILMEKFTEINRFDVIVFQLPDGTIYVKRVIGLPGEEIVYENDQLYVDGKAIEEPFLIKNLRKDDGTTPYTTNFTLEELVGATNLAEDDYFVLGDNRRLSKDSRSFGSVKSQEIIGKARAVYYPLNRMKVIS